MNVKERLALDMVNVKMVKTSTYVNVILDLLERTAKKVKEPILSLSWSDLCKSI